MSTSTGALARDVDAGLRAVETVVRANIGRLRELAKDPSPPGTSLDDGAREFRESLDRVKLLSGVVLPLREESALLRRFADDLTGTQRAIDRASGQALQGLLLQLAGVGLAIGVICIGAVLWRIAAFRYVADGYKRRVVMGARNIVVAVAIVLVVLFHFTSELAALVTILGFAAAGIAFALQNVILAVAGYFSIVAPNGIRIGDRVSLQGPFGYVHGEVTEIGLLRLKLRELVGEQLAPTGRIVVFPNSVVFTGSFFKHPTAEVRA
jgi:small-conductance mechanosensitive channel